ncbi:hypothetical protein LJC19_04920 [Oxalobacter sp. OttesenSCG-928-P03]|nr:hypothetical protein [Oxalobacter sp. OttesenSCG-928-P03]
MKKPTYNDVIALIARYASGMKSEGWLRRSADETPLYSSRFSEEMEKQSRENRLLEIEIQDTLRRVCEE